MKKVALLFVAMLIPMLAMSQSAEIDKLFKKYSGQEGVTVVNIGPELFQIVKGMEIEEIKDAEFPVDKLSGVKVLAIENQEILAGMNFYNEVTSGMNTADFVEVLTVKDGQDDVKMWLKNEGKQIREFLLVVSSPDEGVVVYITGDFNLSDVEGIAESFGDLGDLGALEDLDFD